MRLEGAYRLAGTLFPHAHPLPGPHTVGRLPCCGEGPCCKIGLEIKSFQAWSIDLCLLLACLGRASAGLGLVMALDLLLGSNVPSVRCCLPKGADQPLDSVVPSSDLSRNPAACMCSGQAGSAHARSLPLGAQRC